MNDYLKMEITAEVALQLGDTDYNKPRAESRWALVDIANEIIDSGIVDLDTEDIDEVIQGWLSSNGKLPETDHMPHAYSVELRAGSEY